MPLDLTRRWGGQSPIILGFLCWGSAVALWVEVGLGAVSWSCVSIATILFSFIWDFFGSWLRISGLRFPSHCSWGHPADWQPQIREVSLMTVGWLAYTEKTHMSMPSCVPSSSQHRSRDPDVRSTGHPPPVDARRLGHQDLLFLSQVWGPELGFGAPPCSSFVSTAIFTFTVSKTVL